MAVEGIVLFLDSPREYRIDLNEPPTSAIAQLGTTVRAACTCVTWCASTGRQDRKFAQQDIRHADGGRMGTVGAVDAGSYAAYVFLFEFDATNNRVVLDRCG